MYLAGGVLALALGFFAGDRLVPTMTRSVSPVVRRTPVWLEWNGSDASLRVTLEDAAPLPTAQALRRLLPGWAGGRDGQGVVVLRRRLPGPRGLELGLDGRRLALFLGPPADGVRLSVLGVTTRRLLPEDLRRLRRGIPVGGLGTAWEDLQGLGL